MTIELLATGIAFVGVIGAIVSSITSWRRISDPRIMAEVDKAERVLAASLKEAIPSADQSAVTWDDLAKGTVRDSELREFVSNLANRVSRMEGVSERLEVRRQALLETYHNQGLTQSRISFGFSILLGILGFSIIAYALVTKSNEYGAYASGVITQAVAALFFTQSNQSRELMSRFFDKLRSDRRMEESLRLADGIIDPHLKASLQALLAMQLIDSRYSPSVLPGFRSLAPDSDPTTEPPLAHDAPLAEDSSPG